MLWFYCQMIVIGDDFEGNGNISMWVGDDCQIDISFFNLFFQGSNIFVIVFRYGDMGGQYVNVCFDVDMLFDILGEYLFLF